MTSDGGKPWQNRDQEFEACEGDEVLTLWHEGWACMLDAIGTLTPGDLEKTVYIRREAHMVVVAINR